MRCPMLPLGKASRCGRRHPQGHGKRVGIHVELFNLALYERLGFRKLREFGVYHFTEWSPESSALTGR
jgi:hypothetical protein